MATTKVWKFKNEKNARSFANRTKKAHRIFLGDDGKYWVVTMAQGEKLLAQGYEEITIV